MGMPGRPPEIGKIVVENWCYFPEVYSFGHNSKKYLIKICEKTQFSIEILIKKSQNFVEIFQKSFLVQTRKI